MSNQVKMNSVFRSAVFVGMVSLASMLTACSGGGTNSSTNSTSSTSATIATGRFIDSPVEGLRYTSGGKSGFTNANGEFSYEVGQNVTFYIGNISFSAPGATQLTPLNVFSTSDFNDTRVVNLARLLQTLDADGQPGIKITSAAHTAAANLTLDFSSLTFDGDVAGLIGSATLVSAQNAVTHMLTQLPIAGSWYFENVQGSSRVVLTFFGDNKYMLAEYGPADPNNSGWNGMESGTYTWDSGTGAFSATTGVDTSGDWGLSHPQGSVTVQINGNSMTLTDSVSGAGTATRVPNSNGSIVGSWYADTGSGRAFVTFFSDNKYMFAQYGTAEQSGWSGMESGTYTWDANTGAFSATTAVDTCGDWGLSHPQGTVTVQINGNSMTLTDSVSGGITATRILP